MRIPIRRAVKRLLPSSLFGRALLIMLVPLIVLQLLVAHIFFERHWDSVVRNLSNTLSADIGLIYHTYEQALPEEGVEVATERARAIATSLAIGIERIDDSSVPLIDGHGRKKFFELFDALKSRIRQPLAINDDPLANRVRIRAGLADGGLLEFAFSRKRLASSTTYIFILWMIGTAILLMVIATLFLRNQIKPIVQLARAAEQFGMGQEMVEFTSTRGANEIKRASSAFRTMADRIRRTVSSRTEMLAGISHDLRTPLTRMKLEIEMGKIDQATRDALEVEIEEMRSMIDEYLDFARGDAGEPMERIDVGQLVRDLVESYRRQRRPVELAACEPSTMMLRPQAMRRALTNLIDNALRYGKMASVELEQSVGFVRIKVTDKGPGIPEEEFETVFKPFTRLEASRNVKTGGVGLGLSIARDIALSHGGNISLENQTNRQGEVIGLEVTLRLPREVNG